MDISLRYRFLYGSSIPISGLLASSRYKGAEVCLVRKTILGKPHILMDAVCTFLDPDTSDCRIEFTYAMNEFLNDGIKVSTRFHILTLMIIKPRFVVIRFKLTEEGNYSIHRTHIINIIT